MHHAASQAPGRVPRRVSTTLQATPPGTRRTGPFGLPCAARCSPTVP